VQDGFNAGTAVLDRTSSSLSSGADAAGDAMRSEPLLFSNPGERRRFAPRSQGFIRRARLVNGLLGTWPIVVGTGSWVEAHLVARLANEAQLPNLRGCGVTSDEVLDLVQEVVDERNGLPLALLLDSVAPDQGRKLMEDLHRRHSDLKILLIVQDSHWLTAMALDQCRAQAIVDVQSFGSGTLIRALQLLRRGQRYVDPSLRERLQQGDAVPISGRERQMLDSLVRGLTNRQIAEENEIATTTVRDYISSLFRKLGAANRTQALSRAISLGLVRQRSWSAPLGPGPLQGMTSASPAEAACPGGEPGPAPD